MKIWLLQASEPMPVVNKDERLWRMGMIAEELSNRGHEVLWFANTFDHYHKKQLYDKDTIIKVKENYSLYLFHGIKYKKNISISRIINHKMIANKFRKYANRTDQKPDLIYVSFPTIDYADEAVKYGKKNNIPVIVDIRDLWPDIFNHNLSGIIKLFAQPYIKLMTNKTKKIMKDTYAINGISDLVVEWGLKKGNRDKNKYDRMFYLGYDKKENTDTKSFDIIDDKKFNISFFGTIGNQFNYDIIKEIAQILKEKDKDIQINIAGDGPQFEDLKKKVSEFSNVSLLGWIGKEEINYIMKNSKIGFAPYKNTFDFQMGVSNKFCEYISEGLPVLLTSEGYMKELTEKYKCGFASQNASKICDYIINLKNNKKDYEENSKNAKELYEEKFVAKNIYKELGDYLEEIGGIKK